ncbi:uncharacterized protein EV420DRAFT_1553204 [Desarmillaria tabescens]|uniref:Uncharacterized protein n=1 Tax=Armillaria tabescens TaxID=1929756 RepID=A0AA39N2G8_ARMTA|nr:uncharacterized protein EV420DRAFT_1553204 [Desarmillaria tabescens]KAK0455776.1 hypothetical protein EV420DRAFT_1553204 [Desarmillaria tabescens]
MQTRDHIIRECPRYNGHRDGLRKVSRDLYLPDILGTKRGIEALAAFLEKSGAFTKTGAPKRPPMRPTLDEEEIKPRLKTGWEIRTRRTTKELAPCTQTQSPIA